MWHVPQVILTWVRPCDCTDTLLSLMRKSLIWYQRSNWLSLLHFLDRIFPENLLFFSSFTSISPWFQLDFSSDSCYSTSEILNRWVFLLLKSFLRSSSRFLIFFWISSRFFPSVIFIVGSSFTPIVISLLHLSILRGLQILRIGLRFIINLIRFVLPLINMC